MKTTLTALLIIFYLNVNSQTKQITTNTIYNLDRNVYSEDPFAEKDIMIVKVLQIKNGWVQYSIVKAWCCKGVKFSQSLEVFIDQVNSYKKKYK